MIARSRSRLHVPVAPRFHPKAPNESSAQTVVFLSLLLLLPYFLTKLEQRALLSSAPLAYSAVVLAAIVSANYKYPRGMSIANVAESLECLLDAIQRAEYIHAGKSNIGLLIDQLVVFTLCDRFLPPGGHLTALYSLMFYNVIAYCFGYARQMRRLLTEMEGIRLSLSRSSARHLAASTTNCVLEWTRAVTITVTLVTMLLIFALKHEIHHYGPTWPYLGVTGVYYVMTEKTLVEFLPAFLGSSGFRLFGGCDELWQQAIVKAATATIAAVASVCGFKFGHWGLPLYGLYTCVYIRLKDMNSNELAALRQHQVLLGPFPCASQRELDILDDVCAVCLSQMSTPMGRVTPCQHVFHAECLRRCLLQSSLCPLCKRELLSQ